MTAVHGVRVLRVGRLQVPGPEVFWMSDFDRWHDLQLNVVVIEGPDSVVLVNTGPPSELGPWNEAAVEALGPRATVVREQGESIVEALGGIGLSPRDVTHVILTPLQWYTTANVILFDRAQLCLSRRGWLHFHSTHEHPHDDRGRTFDRETLVHLVTDGWDRVRLLIDEDEVVPGVRTWWAGAHHRASLAIDVDTTVGTVCASDAFFVYDNVESNRVLGINESMEEVQRAYDRVRATADILLPLYDPAVLRRHPDGVVARRPLIER